MKPAPQTPNVLFVVFDDLNTNTGFLGDRAAKTPHLDQFAERATAARIEACTRIAKQEISDTESDRIIEEHTGVDGGPGDDPTPSGRPSPAEVEVALEILNLGAPGFEGEQLAHGQQWRMCSDTSCIKKYPITVDRNGHAGPCKCEAYKWSKRVRRSDGQWVKRCKHGIRAERMAAWRSAMRQLAQSGLVGWGLLDYWLGLVEAHGRTEAMEVVIDGAQMKRAS